MITINLKEIFPVDSQSDLSSKLNFNFNQLLALGFGQAGPIGPIGPSGPAGPIGPIGETGEAGTQIYSSTGLGTGTVSPEPVDALAGDFFIAADGIYKKLSNDPSGGQWEIISDFNDIFSNISSASTSTWQLGLTDPSATSRHLNPVKSFGGIDRVTSAGTSGGWLTNYPNWRNSSEVYINSQASVYNFDPLTTKVYTNGTSGENGYSINIGSNKLGLTGVTEGALPYTSLLSLYSFYETANVANEANQFDDVTGTSSNSYRHQFELGSIDNLTESLVSASGSANYVISPTWQNLRIRKYRSSSGLAGGAIVNADFNLHSSDQGSQPALNSRFVWRINKKSLATVANGSNIEMALSNALIETSNSGLTGIEVDGLHMKSGTSGKIALGIDPANSSTVKNFVISSDTSSSINTVLLRNLNFRLAGTNGTASISSTSFESNRSMSIRVTGNSTLTLGDGTSGRSVFILAPPLQSVFIGSSTSGATAKEDVWTTTSGFALRTKGNRLAAGIPFPAGTSALPLASSTSSLGADSNYYSNVLDEYLEIDFTPTVVWDGVIPTPGNNVLSANEPTIDDEKGRLVKVGRLVHFSVQFSISNWQAKIPTALSGAPSPMYKVGRDVKILNYGNLSTSTTAPFSGMSYGVEPNWLKVRGLPDHWPAISNDFGAGYFNVELSTDKGEPPLRGNPFYFSWGGTGTGGTTATAGTTGTSSRLWNPLDPASIHAKFTTYVGATGKDPQIQLFGHRRLSFDGDAGTSATDAVSPIKSRVSVYDFLRPYSSAKKVFVNIYGSYIVDHQTALQAAPADPSDPVVVDPPIYEA